MGMNCKQGDLAIVVRSYANNEGAIVRCVRLLGVIGIEELGNPSCWEISPALPNKYGFPSAVAADSQLRPLRGLPETEIIEQEQPCKTT